MGRCVAERAPPAIWLGGTDIGAPRGCVTARPDDRERIANEPGRSARQMANRGRRRGCRRAGVAILHRMGDWNPTPGSHPYCPRRGGGQDRGGTRERRSRPHRRLARRAPSPARHPSGAVGPHGGHPQSPFRRRTRLGGPSSTDAPTALVHIQCETGELIPGRVDVPASERLPSMGDSQDRRTARRSRSPTTGLRTSSTSTGPCRTPRPRAAPSSHRST